MGGDSGPEVIVAGDALAWQRRDDLHFLLFGHEDAIQAELAKHGGLEAVSTIIHCDDVISGDDKPSQAIRRAKSSSLGRAIEAVQRREAAAALTCGNTGALIA